MNQRLTAENDTDLFNADNDEDLAAIIMLLCETALDADDEHASVASPATSSPHDHSPANIADEHAPRQRRARLSGDT